MVCQLRNKKRFRNSWFGKFSTSPDRIPSLSLLRIVVCVKRLHTFHDSRIHLQKLGKIPKLPPDILIYLTKLGNGIIILPILSPNFFRIRKKLGNFPNFVKYILSPQGLGAFPHSNLKNDIFRTHSYAHIQGRDDILSSDIYRGKYIS